ncbi:hypothetical protein V8E53_001601 [Lactarius tabidus]
MLHNFFKSLLNPQDPAVSQGNWEGRVSRRRLSADGAFRAFRSVPYLIVPVFSTDDARQFNELSRQPRTLVKRLVLYLCCALDPQMMSSSSSSFNCNVQSLQRDTTGQSFVTGRTSVSFTHCAHTAFLAAKICSLSHASWSKSLCILRPEGLHTRLAWIERWVPDNSALELGVTREERSRRRTHYAPAPSPSGVLDRTAALGHNPSHFPES